MVTTDFTVRLLVAGPRPLKLGFDTSDSSLSISRRTKSESLTCGVISSLSATSWRCTDVPKPKVAPGSAVAAGAGHAARREAAERAGERQVLTDLDGRLLVVGGEHVRHRHDVDVAVVLQRLHEHAEARHRRARRQAEDLSAPGMAGPRRPAARPDSAAGEKRIEFTSDDGSEPPKRSDWSLPVPTVEPPCQATPSLRVLSTEISRMVGLDEDLLARHVELLDEVAHGDVVAPRGQDDERVGRLVRRDAHVAFEEAVLLPVARPPDDGGAVGGRARRRRARAATSRGSPRRRGRRACRRCRRRWRCRAATRAPGRSPRRRCCAPTSGRAA